MINSNASIPLTSGTYEPLLALMNSPDKLKEEINHYDTGFIDNATQHALVTEALTRRDFEAYKVLRENLSVFECLDESPQVIHSIFTAKTLSDVDIARIVKGLPDHFTKIPPEDFFSKVIFNRFKGYNTGKVLLLELSKKGLPFNKEYRQVLVETFYAQMINWQYLHYVIINAYKLIHWLSADFENDMFKERYTQTMFKNETTKQFIASLRVGLKGPYGKKCNEAVLLISIAHGSDLTDIMNAVCASRIKKDLALNLCLEIIDKTPLEALSMPGLNEKAKAKITTLI